MKESFLIISLLINSFILMAQDEAMIDIDKETYEERNTEHLEEGWSVEGNIFPVVGQTAFNDNWIGRQPVDMTVGLTVSSAINYKKEKVIIDNEVAAGYGIGATRLTDNDRSIRKISDHFEVNSILGSKIRRSQLYYSLALNFKTQFNRGYQYKEDELGNEIKTERTHFFSPADIKLGPGILYKKEEHFFVNVSPVAGRVTLVDRTFTEVDPLDEEALEHYENHRYYGVEANKSSLWEFGTAIRTFLKFDIVKNLSFSNSLELYSNYLEAPQNVDLDYTANLSLVVGKYLSTRVVFRMVYDDDAVGNLQIKEAFGIGANYQF
ncbi:Protein of unknown function (DUF3078) [Aquimarina sp. MAR_2010_214]|uniref:DUF3078 domain-containing protein n=1 Tax=Aquimarina sp. MAR_2010_214 TaxID=1250026 RepID=UPI000C712720|nr:DUF3078 domain-containing protein [Aquimarina sp. MAR_2010_214]PKV52890.1 Protein of unknown function (DUF3078) [Aquimarina sp. MAR_2010_214]